MHLVTNRRIDGRFFTSNRSAARDNAPVLTRASSKRHEETLSQLLAAITRRGLTIFAQFDHAAAARDVSMELAPETVVVFGNPRAGTPLMQADPRIGLELPLRIVLWTGDHGTTIGYSDPRELAGIYEVGEHAGTLEAMAALLSDLAQEAAI